MQVAQCHRTYEQYAEQWEDGENEQLPVYSQTEDCCNDAEEDFERQFTASTTYDTTQSLNSVQEELVTQMVKDITDQIFNATVANW